MSTRAEQLEENFQRFHIANPEVWLLFRMFTLEAIKGGRTHYSADAICHRIRWHMDIEQDPADAVKLNNNFTALYASMFHHRHPEHANFFRNRERISESQPARHPDVQFNPAPDEA